MKVHIIPSEKVTGNPLENQWKPMETSGNPLELADFNGIPLDTTGNFCFQWNPSGIPMASSGPSMEKPLEFR